MQTVTAASITAAAHRMRRLRARSRLPYTDGAAASGERFKYWDSSITESERIRNILPCFSDAILADHMYHKPDF
jgi:hypothetical protein